MALTSWPGRAKRKNSVGRTFRVFPAIVKIIKFKIQEPMNDLILKNEASNNSLHLADTATFCAFPWTPFYRIIETIEEE